MDQQEEDKMGNTEWAVRVEKEKYVNGSNNKENSIKFNNKLIEK